MLFAMVNNREFYASFFNRMQFVQIGLCNSSSLSVSFSWLTFQRFSLYLRLCIHVCMFVCLCVFVSNGCICTNVICILMLPDCCKTNFRPSIHNLLIITTTLAEQYPFDTFHCIPMCMFSTVRFTTTTIQANDYDDDDGRVMQSHHQLNSIQT